MHELGALLGRVKRHVKGEGPEASHVLQWVQWGYANVDA